MASRNASMYRLVSSRRATFAICSSSSAALIWSSSSCSCRMSSSFFSFIFFSFSARSIALNSRFAYPIATAAARRSFSFWASYCSWNSTCSLYSRSSSARICRSRSLTWSYASFWALSCVRSAMFILCARSMSSTARCTFFRRSCSHISSKIRSSSWRSCLRASCHSSCCCRCTATCSVFCLVIAPRSTSQFSRNAWSIFDLAISCRLLSRCCFSSRACVARRCLRWSWVSTILSRALKYSSCSATSSACSLSRRSSTVRWCACVNSSTTSSLRRWRILSWVLLTHSANFLSFSSASTFCVRAPRTSSSRRLWVIMRSGGNIRLACIVCDRKRGGQRG
mmetsp:Transcript_11405/g.20978  ORF Transcript_11405/g.20978 Transcript_11405/m.20978 type:complete len:338 (+) Transcript_11405:887-1900(+)